MRNVYNYDVSVVMFLYELYQRNNDFTDGRVRLINVIGSSCDDRKALFFPRRSNLLFYEGSTCFIVVPGFIRLHTSN